MKARVLFPDAAAEACTLLRTALAARPEAYAAGATVGTKVPDARSPEDPRLPLVLVALDGATPHPSRLNAEVVLRISVWHADNDQAHDLAQLAAALLHTAAGPVIRSTRPGTGPVPGVDPDSGVALATLTLTANIAPTPLT
ncbi:hypothetical protein GCM10009639_53940 [Kitasatospora putterlickiae]|uniref:Tail terminator n=1 Tax=Kitasatospora putterlickiae TaxID=221725 RepID=A0ABP4J3F8_9ACTN